MNPVAEKVPRSLRDHVRSRRGRIVLSSVVVSIGIAFLVPYVDWAFPTLRTPRGTINFDEGTYLYQAYRIARGHVIYRDFFDFKGIAAYLPFALLFAVVGPSVVAARLLMIAIVASIGAAAFETCRLAAGRATVPAYLAAAFPALLVWPSWPNPYHDLLAQLFFLLALLFGARALRGSTWALFFAGLLCGLASWTHLAQGVTGTIAFAGSLMLIQLGRGAPRAAARWVGIFLCGFVALSASMLLYFWLEDALGEFYESVLVFPFEHYGSVNKTKYAFDVGRYGARWFRTNPVAGAAAWVMGVGLAAVPVVAAGVSLGAAWVALKRAFRGLRKRALQAGPQSGELSILALSLSAVVIPVVAGYTRSDLCHIGFVAPVAFTGLMVLAASAEGFELPRAIRLASRAYVGIYAVALGVAALFLIGCVIGPYAPRSIFTLDEQMRADFGCHGDRALLKDGDTTVYLPRGYFPGGFHYLLTEHDSAISYSLLEHQAAYYGGQWERAAEEISKRKPVFMRITPKDFRAFSKHVPELERIYYGSANIYALVERKPGPPLDRSTEWGAVIQSAAGARSTGHVLLEASPQARLLATLSEAGKKHGPLLGRIDGSTIAVWHGNATYVGELSPDGRNISGRIYVKGQPEAESARFEWRLMTASPDSIEGG
jgi:hypothetical protein